MNLLRAVRSRSSGTAPSVGDLWSDPATWGGSVPTTDDDVTIPFGMSVTLDTTTAILANLRIEGDLIISDTVDTHLRAKKMSGSSTGRYLSGASRLAPNLKNHTRTLSGLTTDGGGNPNPGPSHTVDTPTASYPNDVGGVNRGFLREDGFTYKIYGYVPDVICAKVNLSATGGPNVLPAGTTVIPLDQGVTWEAGDEIIIPPTGWFHGSRRTESFIVQADTNGAASVTINAPGLGYDRWAKIQYLNDDYTVSVDSSSGYTTHRPTLDHTATIDERARVLHVSRRHLVTCPADTERTDKRYGAHDMDMGNGTTTPTSEIDVYGVQFDFCGQGGLQGRYPIHAHVPSYNTSTGAHIGDYAAGQYVFDSCTITRSFNRSIVPHGACGCEFRNNIAYDVKGQSFFSEEGSEERMIVEDNYFYMTDDPGLGDSPAQIAYAPRGYRIKFHDRFGEKNTSGASGMWVTNVNNTYRRNVSGDNNGNGFWMSLSIDGPPGATAGCWGLTKLANIDPFYTVPLVWEGNEAHSNVLHGRDIFTSASDEAGHVTEQGKIGSGSSNEFELSDEFYWKNYQGYLHTVYKPKIRNFTFADNGGFDIHGTTQLGNGSFTFVDQTLNTEIADWPAGRGWRTAGVSYHGTFHFIDTVWFGYDLDEPYVDSHDDRTHLWTNAALGGFDNYTGAYFSFSRGFTNNHMGPTDGGMYLTPGGHIQTVSPYSTWSLGVPSNLPYNNHCFAFYDHFGNVFNQGAGKTVVPDMPFFTTGLTSTAYEPNGIPMGMRITSSEFIGVRAFDGGYTGTTGTTTATRVNTATGADVGGATLPSAYSGACKPGEGFRISNTGGDLTSLKYRLNTQAMNTANFIYFGVPVLSSRTLTRVDALNANIHASTGTAISSVADWAALVAATANRYWRTGDIVWVKIYMPSDALYLGSVGTVTKTEDYEWALLVTAS
jgi:hypothetical protein